MTGAQGQRILLIGPKVFNYEREIAGALQRRGAVVSYLNDRPSEGAWLKALLRLFPRVGWLWGDRHYSRWLASEAPAAIDTVLVLKGEGLSPRMLRRLRAHYPAARFILYLWDSIANTPGATSRFGVFDLLYSQDPKDCRTHPALRYRPLFFLRQYQNASSARGPASGCFFLGTLNGDRPKVLGRIATALEGVSPLEYWLYVRSGVELRLRWFVDYALRRLDPRRLIRTPRSAEDIARRFATAEAIVDIEHYRQSGLTIRTFEALAAGCKLITTNRRIEQESFYDPGRILIIDRERPVVSEGFLHSEAPPLPANFFSKYSLDGWLEELLH
jgi:hypothetical protein